MNNINYDYIHKHEIVDELTVPMQYQIPKDISSPKIHTYKSAYISLTYACNMHGVCGYCYSYDQKSFNTMTINEFSTILKYLVSISDCQEISFVGGEPTTVNSLPEYFDVCNEYGLKAILYTNACCSPIMMQKLLNKKNLSEISVHFIPEIFYSSQNQENFHETLKIINNYSGEKSIIFVIDEHWKNQYYDDLFSLALKYHYSLRWIFATPTSRITPSLSLSQMRYITHTSLQPFLLKCLNNNIHTYPDLTIPLCVFDEKFLLEYNEKLHLIKLCSPFIYFKPDSRMQYCTSLNDIVRPLPQSENDVKDFINRNRCLCNNIKKIPSFPECTECKLWKKQICQGGCLTYKLFRGEE